jgi:photosystem II stability/assembly factor-like uncharacterized protein
MSLTLIKPWALILLVNLTPALGAPGEWEWQNPLPQGNTLRSIFFLNDDTGFLSGQDGAFLKTEDGGRTWSVSKLPGGGTGMELAFKDAHTGLAIVKEWSPDPIPQLNMYRTGDGGLTWDKIMPLRKIHPMRWSGGETVYLAGDSGLLVSRNAGRDWEVCRLFRFKIEAISFPDTGLGYVLAGDESGNAAAVFRTSDGGSHFDSLPLPDSVDYRFLDFPDARTGIVIGEGSKGRILFRSEDSAKTWTRVETSGSGIPDLRDLRFFNAMKGIGFDLFGSTLRTIDGGITWDPLGSKGKYALYNKAVFPSERIAYRVGEYGTIEKSSDGGLSWGLLNQGIIMPVGGLADVAFVDSQIGCAVGGLPSVPLQEMRGLIIRTLDAGAHWDTLPSPGGKLNSIRFRGTELGITVGDSGYVFRTEDRGAKWKSVGRISDEDLISVRFGDGNDVFACGIHSIYRSRDAGLTWTKSFSDTGFALSSMDFRGSGLGLAVGSRPFNGSAQGLLLRTTDGGTAWKESPLTDGLWVAKGLNVVHIGPTGVAFAADAKGFLFRSTDAGSTWDSIAHLESSEPRSIAFIGPDTGFAISGDGILRTVDGGKGWEMQSFPAPKRMAAMAFPNGGDGYAVGGYGFILKYDRGANGTQRLAESRYLPRLILNGKGVRYHLESRTLVAATFFGLDGAVLSRLSSRVTEPGERLIEIPASVGSRPWVLDLEFGNRHPIRLIGRSTR